ncbi:MAG: hypothetical protein L6300_05205 [Syntrophaceae bacterium]|nr:hypothetical protein [Syntrophaceae bacterium]
MNNILLIDQMVANIKKNARILDEKSWEEFITWLRDRTGQAEIIHEGKLDGRLAEWLQTFDPTLAVIKYRLILNEIKWLQHKNRRK